MNRKLIKWLMLFPFIFILLSADVYDQDWTVISDRNGSLSAVITFPARTDSTGSDHSNALFIGGFNDADGYINATSRTASDKNIILHFSNDLRNWTSRTMTGLDATSSTMKIDTLGDAGCPEWHSYNWVIVEDDGQAAATSDDVLDVAISGVADKDNSRTVESGDNWSNP